MEGWIKLHRKILDNPIVMKDAETFAVWTYLLLNATHKDFPAIFKGEKITLHAGQLLTGRKSIAKNLRVNESKVYRILEMLKSEHQIEQQRGSHNSLITILNWDKYQLIEHQIEQPMNNCRTSDEHLMNTNKNIKNNKNKRNKNIALVGGYDYENLEKELSECK